MQVEDLLQNIAIGDDAKKFLNSEIGTAIQERGQREIEDFQTKLQCIGTPHEESEKLRGEIHARLKMFEWMVQAINEANGAETVLNNQED